MLDAQVATSTVQPFKPGRSPTPPWLFPTKPSKDTDADYYGISFEELTASADATFAVDQK